MVIDMQSCAFDGKHAPPIDSGEALLGAVSRLVERARERALPVIYTQHCASQGLLFREGSEGWRIHPRIAPQASDTIVYKTQSSAFDDTRLGDVLGAKRIDTVIVCGIQSEYCVSATTLAALEQGLTAYVASDGHGTLPTDDADARSIIERQNRSLSEAGVLVRTTEDLVALLHA